MARDTPIPTTTSSTAWQRRAPESFGFRECGAISGTNGTQRIAYDWIKDAPRDGTSQS